MNHPSKHLFLLLFLGMATFAQSQQKFQVKGTLKNISMPVTKVYLNYYQDGKSHADSSDVVDGKYSFTGSFSDPIMVSLRAKYQEEPGATKIRAISYKRDIAQLFMENSKMSITHVDSFANATLKGSKANLEYLQLKALTKDITEQQEKLSKEYNEYYKKKDEAGMKKVDEAFEAVEAQSKEKHKEYLLANPNVSIAMHAFRQFAGYDINADEAEPLFLKLSETVRNSAGGKEMAERIEIAKKVGIGRIAPDFTQNDTLGNPVSLSSFRGKFLLIDFWASWCGPCRQENPNVVAAFKKYNNKGFDILGVSLDQPTGKEKWLKAIHDDNLTWTQVSDLKFWGNAVAAQYGIQAIPQNFLLDPNGKIIGKNLRGEALNKKLEEIMK